MKKLFVGLVVLFMFYLGIEWAFVYFGKGHEINYEINKNGNKFEISETFKANQKEDRDNYYLKIKFGDISYTYQVFDNLDKKSKIIKDIYYYEDDNNKCILPVFKGNQYLFDVMCYDGVGFNYYNNISSPNEGLKSFVRNLKNYGYDESNWIDKKEVLYKTNMLTVYKNLVNKHYVGISNYKGVSLINKKNTVKNVDIFSKDIYQRTISTFANGLYITADYTGINNFSDFEILNLKTGDISKISSDYKISFNSYILGNVADSIYLYDRESRYEYEINLRTRNIDIVGEKDKYIKYYSKGKWSNLNIDDFKDNQTFDLNTNNDYVNDSYINIVKVGNNVGYYYLFKQVENKYQVYRINIQNNSNLTYLFTTTDYSKIIFLDDYIYYLDNNDLKYYSDKTGNRILANNTEFEFNNTVKFGIYEEK